MIAKRVRSGRRSTPGDGHLTVDPVVAEDGEVDCLEAGLTTALNRLDRWFEGRFVAQTGPDDEVVLAADYEDPAFLEAAIVRARSMHARPVDAPTEDDESLDLRIAVSRFTRQYSSSLSAVALVALANGIGLDVSPDRCRLIIRSNIPFLTVLDLGPGDVVRCAERPTTWRVDGPVVETLAELREFVWSRLFGRHLGPLYARIGRVVHVSPSLMWSNAAEWVANVSDAADEYLDPDAAAPYLDDRQALLDAPELPEIHGPNPMTGLIRWQAVEDPWFPHGVQTRRVCCITYLLEDRLGRLCQNCPFLGLDDRMALIRERHGVPMSEPGGPAAGRAIEVGLAKLGRTGSATRVD